MIALALGRKEMEALRKNPDFVMLLLLQETERDVVYIALYEDREAESRVEIVDV